MGENWVSGSWQVKVEPDFQSIALGSKAAPEKPVTHELQVFREQRPVVATGASCVRKD